VALLVGGCGVQAPVPAGQAYEVVAPLFSLKGSPTQACNGILLSYPPAGCGGVLVSGVDIRRIPGMHRYWNGTMETPAQRLHGVWIPSKLTLALTEPARPASYPAGQDSTCAPTSPAIEPGLLAQEAKVAQDEAAIKQHGVALLEFGPCGDALSMLVAVADSAASTYLQGRYGSVVISGWLTPVG
jgi:hypothetical protein